MEVNVEEVRPEKARKKYANPAEWKINKEKVSRYSPKVMPTYPACGHRGNGKNCSLLKMVDIKEFHSAFYAVKTKASQDAFILKYCSTSTPERSRPRTGERGKKEIIFQYFVKNQAGNRIQVCRGTFLQILGITKHRVEGVFKRFKKQAADIPVETRGGYRKEEKYRGKLESVVNFIKQFKGLESHYSRKKSCRIYLSSDLSIAKMWRMYQDYVTDSFKVTEGFFRNVFVSRFNLSFKTPATDVCSKCLELTGTIKREKIDENKNALRNELMLHKTMAKAFFSLLKEKQRGIYIMSFDMQKNLPLPKLPDQICYYSRQLYCYNLTIVSGISSGKDALQNKNVSVYTWCEHEMSKSSNEVSSAVYKELQTKLLGNELQDVHTVRLVADGCGGQNKNTIVLAMCLMWLYRSPEHIQRMEVIFPVTGHSFMPSDRIFGLIERDINKKDTIVEPRDYHKAFADHGTVKQLGIDWINFDWKTQAKRNVKETKDLHFKISRIRRLVLQKQINPRSVTVQGEMSYLTDTAQALGVMKQGKRISMIKPTEVLPGVRINAAKIKDVQKLLEKHYGNTWGELENLKWYRKIINEQNNNLAGTPEGNHDKDPDCECFNGDNNDELEVIEIVFRNNTITNLFLFKRVFSV